MNMDKFDYKKLCEVLKAKHITKENFSYMLGRGKTYVSSMQHFDTITEQQEALICKMLELPAGSFVKEDKAPETNQGVDAVVNVLKNIFELLNQVKADVESLKIQNDKTFSKVNANTLQLERIKERFIESTKTDFEKACEFLQEQLSVGKVDGVELLQRCDAAGLKRSEVMKAKKELDVHISTTGYGKNQKSFWYITR